MSKRSSKLTFSVIFEDENEDENEDHPFNEDQQDGALEIAFDDFEAEFLKIELAQEALNGVLFELNLKGNELSRQSFDADDILEEKGTSVGQLFPQNVDFIPDPIVSENKATQIDLESKENEEVWVKQRVQQFYQKGEVKIIW